MSPNYKLYYSLRSPFARRVRIALERLLIPYEAKEEDVFRPSAEFLSANPLGLLPCLQFSQDFSLADSTAILEYLEDRYGHRIWPSDLDERLKVRSAATFAHGLMGATVSLFLEGRRAHPSIEWMIEHRENIDRTLDALERLARLEFPFVRGAELTQAGFDAITALDYLDVRTPQVDWSENHPGLKRFRDSHANHPVLKRTAPPPV